jgi:signal transduction histidine kinase
MAETLGSARILVVEDNAASRRMIARCLQGGEVVDAPDGETALHLLDRQRFDVVLLDIGLPGIDGYQVLHQIRSDRATAGPMVIMVTARGQAGEVVKGFEFEADDYMVKPFRPEELRARVQAAVRLKRLQDELRRLNADLEAEVDLRTAQLLAQQQFTLLGRNTAQLAHNLNSPLTALMGYLELARRAKPAARGELLERACQVSEDMAAIIARLLTGVRSRDSLRAEAEALNLNEIIDEQVSFWRVDTRFRYDSEVVLALDPDLPLVMADRMDLAQILNNLIENALYALKGHPDATLTLTTGQSAGEVVLTVADNGCGIAPEHLPRVCDPNFTTKPVGEGTGLGLASCTDLAAAHGGRLELRSELGRGTTVTLALPAVGAAAAPTPAPDRARAKA